jgi:hypothetical protein
MHCEALLHNAAAGNREVRNNKCMLAIYSFFARKASMQPAPAPVTHLNLRLLQTFAGIKRGMYEIGLGLRSW